MNVAVSRRSDEFFKAGEEYRILSYGTGYVEIMSKNDKHVRVDMDDKDFVLIFNRDTGDGIDIKQID